MDANNIKSGINITAQLESNLRNKVDNKMNLEQVAQEFESIFVHQMLKSTRSAKLADGIFNSEAEETYQTLLDQEYSKTLAKSHNFGIAEALVRQFEKFVSKEK